MIRHVRWAANVVGVCGIAGVAAQNIFTDPNQLFATVRSMTERIAHRGPDGSGHVWSSGAQMRTQIGRHGEAPLKRSYPRESTDLIALGHRRLAIVDLVSGGQPMSDPEGRVWLTFNGEIYNNFDLRAELQALGHHFVTTSDTEALLHAYLQWGDECFKRLRGMFACGIWDDRSSSLLLARDRLGIKPLLWAETPRALLFASELKGLLASGLLSRQIDPGAIYRFIHNLYVPAPHAPFHEVHVLEPGHFLRWQKGKITKTRYWSATHRPAPARSAEEWTELFLETLSGAVSSHLMADVPVGTFLSGGLDSSAISALAARHLGPSSKLLTATVGFSDPRFDESADALRIAQHIGAEPLMVQVGDEQIEKGLEQVLKFYDQPFADSSALPTLLLCQATSEKLKVVLSGDGSDELLAGYPRHQQFLRLDQLRRSPSWVKSALLKLNTGHLADRLLGARARNLRLAATFLTDSRAGTDDISAYAYLRDAFRVISNDALLTPEFALQVRDIDPFEHIRQAARHSDASTALERLLEVEQHTYLPNDILQKVDIASMAFGLEVRVPFLDHHVVELVASMPQELKLKRRLTKVVLRRALCTMLPKRTFQKPKQGFHVPIGPWLRNKGKNFLLEHLASKRHRERGYFQESCVQQLIQQHLEGTHDHASRLWALLQLETWHRGYADPEPAAVVAEPL